MILGLVLALALALRGARGANVREISQIHMRGERLFLSTALLVALFPALAGMLHPSRSLVIPIWLTMMALLLVLCLSNRALARGFVIMALGVALNLCAIAANGHMPVSSSVARVAGGEAAVAVVNAGDLFHSAARSSTRLLVLSDALPLPGPPGFRSILSVGDVLMLVGILTVIVAFEPARVPDGGNLNVRMRSPSTRG